MATSDDGTGDPGDYDPDDLRDIQYLRASIDPIPVHPRRGQLVASTGSDGLSRESVVEARLDQVSTQEITRPLDVVPWEEAMLCMQSTFNDATFATTPVWVGAIKYTFRQYLSTLGMDPDEALPKSFTAGPPIPDALNPESYTPAGEEAITRNPDPDSVSLMGITDGHQAVAEGFRHHLKHVRDRVFLAEYYDNLMTAYPGDLAVPKLVWREAALANASADECDGLGLEDDDEGAQTGLDMF